MKVKFSGFRAHPKGTLRLAALIDIDVLSGFLEPRGQVCIEA